MSTFTMLTGRSQNHLTACGRFFIHQEIAHDFELFASEMKVEGFTLEIASAFRDYERQCLIWNEKVEGKRPLLDREGNTLNIKNLTEKEILYTILSWSALPGCSRHHWGTDLDLYDSSAISPDYKLKLENDEYLTGPFAKMNLHLQKYLIPNKFFPFFRPYNSKHLGVMQELWHYSHKKLGKQFYKDYTFSIFIKNLKESNFHLRELAQKEAHIIYTNYFLRVTN